MKRMRNVLPLAIVLAALGIGGSLLLGPALAQEKDKDKVASPTVKWEYKVHTALHTIGSIDTQKLEEALNELGKHGWECAGTLSEVNGGLSKQPIQTRGLVILKRPKH